MMLFELCLNACLKLLCGEPFKQKRNTPIITKFDERTLSLDPSRGFSRGVPWGGAGGRGHELPGVDVNSMWGSM